MSSGASGEGIGAVAEIGAMTCAGTKGLTDGAGAGADGGFIGGGVLLGTGGGKFSGGVYRSSSINGRCAPA